MWGVTNVRPRLNGLDRETLNRISKPPNPLKLALMRDKGKPQLLSHWGRAKPKRSHGYVQCAQDSAT